MESATLLRSDGENNNPFSQCAPPFKAPRTRGFFFGPNEKRSPVAGADEGTSPRRKSLAARLSSAGFLSRCHLAPLFILRFLLLADFAPPFSFFIQLGLLLAALAGLLTAAALLLAAFAALLFLLFALIGHPLLLVELND
jgi:hypothetical protein